MCVLSNGDIPVDLESNTKLSFIMAMINQEDVKPSIKGLQYRTMHSGLRIVRMPIAAIEIIRKVHGKPSLSCSTPHIARLLQSKDIFQPLQHKITNHLLVSIVQSKVMLSYYRCPSTKRSTDVSLAKNQRNYETRIGLRYPPFSRPSSIIFSHPGRATVRTK